MFCQLFGGDPQSNAKPPKDKKKQKTSTKPKAKPKKKEPEPKAVEQECAPFDHVEEESPEPMHIETLDYEDIEEAIQDDEWEEEEEVLSDDQSENYEATSMSDENEISCSVDSSPGFLFERRTVTVEKKRKPGIPVFFDDESWIN